MAKRPLGVAILAVLWMLVGVVNILYSICIFLFSTLMGSYLLGVMSILPLISSIFYLVIGIGLWKLKNWVRILVLVLLSLGVLLSIIPLLFGDYLEIIPISISIIIIWYLLQPNVGSAFTAHKGSVFGGVDDKEDTERRRLIMARISEERKTRAEEWKRTVHRIEKGVGEEEWKKTVQTINIKKLLSLMVGRGEIMSSDAAKELEVDRTTIANYVAYLEKNGFITIEGDTANPYLKPTKALMERVKKKQ